MEITTLMMILMASALVILAIVVGLLVMHLFHKNDELREKNNVIVREIRRNQELIDRAVHHGINRAAMLTSIMIPLLLCAGMFVSGTRDHAASSLDPFFTNSLNINLKLNFNYESTTDLLKHYPEHFDELMNTAQLSKSGGAEAARCNYFENIKYYTLRGICN
jgi:hypothetical protein